MGVNESTLDEMFNERAHYLFNIDELLLEQLSTTDKYKKFGESLEPISNIEFEPICLRKLRNHELLKFNSI